MTRSISVYICLLVCLSCFAASAISNNDEIDPSKILLVFYNCISTDEISIRCLINDTDCIESAYNQIKKDRNETTVYIHGYNGSINTVVLNIVSAYCSRNFSVIAILDWSLLASEEISLVSYQVPKIAKIIASTFNFLNNKGYEIAKWHLIGHSMGAQVVGCIGTNTDFSFSHITGLDPSNGIFYSEMYKDCRINPEVADFTEAFYTDRGGYATVTDVGSFNIYVNSGSAPQPGCCSSPAGIHECSHIKAVEWYADAVRNETKYLATKCTDCMMFQVFNHCKENDRTYYGPHINTNARGKYCLTID